MQYSKEKCKYSFVKPRERRNGRDEGGGRAEEGNGSGKEKNVKNKIKIFLL